MMEERRRREGREKSNETNLRDVSYRAATSTGNRQRLGAQVWWVCGMAVTMSRCAGFGAVEGELGAICLLLPHTVTA